MAAAWGAKSRDSDHKTLGRVGGGGLYTSPWLLESVGGGGGPCVYNVGEVGRVKGGGGGVGPFEGGGGRSPCIVTMVLNVHRNHKAY